MQLLTSLFGGSQNTALTAILALGVVLVLIVLGVWALKVFFKASTNIGRGRIRRLSVVDSVAVDPRRQLLIVRRDDVEHLILTGGPQDLVVETGIPVETGPRNLRRPVPPALAAATFPSADATAKSHVPAAKSHAPAAKPPAAPLPIRSHMDRLRDLGRPAVQRKPPSLRHTGLMRSVSRPEPAVIPMNPEKTDHPHLDSATTSPANDTNGQTKLGAGSFYGDASKAEGH